MFQRDFIMNEARKFALMLAKLLGLKAEGEHEEYLKYFNEVLDEEYNAELEGLIKLNDEDFKKRLIDAGYTPEKLNALSQMLYVFAEPFNADEETSALLKKVMLIFDLLETEHQYESFDNITKRNVIYKYLNNTNERA